MKLFLLSALCLPVADSFRPPSSFQLKNGRNTAGGKIARLLESFGPIPGFEPGSSVTSSFQDFRRPPSSLFMYNLPPSNDRNNDLGPLVSGVLTFLGIILFFASPLGALFFAVFNSLVFLSIAIPVAAAVGFQVWQYFNTISGPCPSCGSPLRVMKQSGMESAPSICLNCGSFVQATADNAGIELLGRPTSSSFGEDLIQDFWSGWLDPSAGVRRVESPDAVNKRFKREQTIIDIEAKDENDDDTSKRR